MAEVFEPVIRIDTGDSELTVKDLKREISTLRDEILNLEKGTEQYDTAVKKLQDDQRKLDEVMALTKRTATALDGSYDALTQQMSLLKKEWRATNDEARRSELAQKIAEINNELKEMDAEIGNFQRNVGNYVSHWEGMEEAVADFGTEMRNAMESIEPVKAKFESVQKIAGGLASGFAAVQGAAALLNIENENLEKSLVKVQAAMALAQGIGGIGDLVEGVSKASVAFKGLNDKIKLVSKTMGKAGWLGIILAVVAAVTALIQGLSVVKEKESAWARQMEETKRAQDKLRESIENSNNEMDRRVRLMKAQGAEERAIIEAQLGTAKTNMNKLAENHRQADNQYRSVKENAEGVNAMSNWVFKDVYGMSKDEALEYYKGLKDEAYALYKVEWDRVEELKFQLELLDEIEKRKKKETSGSTTTTTTTSTTTKDDPNEILKRSIQERIKLEDQATDRKLKNLEVEKGKAEAIAYETINDETQLKARLEEINREYAGKEYEIELESKEAILGILKEWETANTDAKMQQVEISQEIADQEVEIEALKQQRLTELAEQGNNDRNRKKTTETKTTTTTDVKKSVESAGKAIENFNDLWETLDTKGKINEVANITSEGLSAVGNVMEGITSIYQASAEKDGEISKKEAKKLKNLQIATATINMLQGAISAYAGAQTIPPPVGPIIGGINAAAVIAMGTANIMKIKNTDLTGSVPQGAMGAVTPNSNIYGTDIPFSYTRNITSASEVDKLNQETKVYVLESDITNAVNKQKVRVEESSF